jgi:hypothetical protein
VTARPEQRHESLNHRNMPNQVLGAKTRWDRPMVSPHSLSEPEASVSQFFRHRFNSVVNRIGDSNIDLDRQDFLRRFPLQTKPILKPSDACEHSHADPSPQDCGR